MSYDPNYHRAKILFQDLPTGQRYDIIVKDLYTQLKAKYNPSPIQFRAKEYHRNCVLLENCFFKGTVTLKVKEITVASGQTVDISFPPSLFTKIKECTDSEHMLENQSIQLTVHITNEKARGGSRKWVIAQIRRYK